MKLDKKGYSLVEVLIVLVIAGVLLNVSLKSTGSVTARLSVNLAQHSFVALHARARAHAVERGTSVDFHVDPVGDSAWVEIDGETLEVARFDAVDPAASGAITVCMSPRGIADTRCNSFSAVETETFEARGESSSLDILPLGKVILN